MHVSRLDSFSQLELVSLLLFSFILMSLVDSSLLESKKGCTVVYRSKQVGNSPLTATPSQVVRYVELPSSTFLYAGTYCRCSFLFLIFLGF